MPSSRTKPTRRPQHQAPLSSPAFLHARLPAEILQRIFVRAASLDQVTGVHLLQVNHAWRHTLEPIVYARVELRTAHAISTFCTLVRARADLARAVRRLWIGPVHARSDLLTILALPTIGDSLYLATQREHVYNDTRIILRACRRLDDVALSGSLIATDVVHSYGTACQPTIITSINPHSFISGFDAPIFRRVHTLTVCDINLSFSEAMAIRRMPSLRTLCFTSPKDYGDPQIDANVLQKILVYDDPLESLATLRLDDAAALHMMIRALPHRAKQVADALRASLADNERANDLNAQHTSDQEHNALHPDTILDDEDEEVRQQLLHQRLRQQPLPLQPRHQPCRAAVHVDTRTLPSTFVDAWDALRDLVFNAQEDYSRMALEDDVGTWVDPSHALELLYEEWHNATPHTPTPPPSASTPTQPVHT